MSFHEGSNWQAKKEDEKKPLYEFEKNKQTLKELNQQTFSKLRPNFFILRSSKGISQKELSKELGMNPTRNKQTTQGVGSKPRHY